MGNQRQLRIALLAAASSIHVVKLANGLVESGHDVHLVSQHEPRTDLDPRVHLHTLPFSRIPGYFFNLPWAWRILRRLKPDLTNVHYATGYGFLGHAARGLKILTTFGSDILVFPKRGWIYRVFLQTNLWQYPLIVTPSVTMARATRALFPRGQYRHIPCGIDYAFFKGIAAERTPDRFVIGACRALEPVYGIDLLIEAFALFIRRRQPRGAELHIIGGGRELNRLKDLAGQLGLTEKITFHGFLSQAAVADHLSRWHVGMMPSRSEALGVAAIEAGACGLPVIATNVGGLPEVVLDGETGLLAEPTAESLAEKIDLLYQDEPLRLRLGARARSYLTQTYTLDTMIKQYAALYAAFAGRQTQAVRAEQPQNAGEAITE